MDSSWEIISENNDFEIILKELPLKIFKPRPIHKPPLKKPSFVISSQPKPNVKAS